MKTKLALFATWLAATASLAAAPLTATTAVQTRPDDAAPVVSYLKAGTEPMPAAAPAALANTPAGWMAVDLAGPFEAYVENKEIGKGLDVRVGASLYLQPKLDSGVLTTMEKGDKVEITGLRGKWTQVHLDKKLIGYIRLTGVASNIVVAPVADTQAAAPAPVPLAPTTSIAASPGQPAPMVSLGDSGSSSLPRLFQGKFASSKRPFAPRRPYDYQINDDAGVRYAYLDLSKLLLTDAIENYLDRVVVVYGTAKNVPGTKDIVIEIESLQLK